jgi:hypothetical protein
VQLDLHYCHIVFFNFYILIIIITNKKVKRFFVKLKNIKKSAFLLDKIAVLNLKNVLIE